MAMTDSGRQFASMAEDDDLFASTLQLRLAESIINSLIKRNGGSGAGDVFWCDDPIEDADGREEYSDPEMWDPDGEEVPEMADIVDENIFECL